MGVYFRSVHSLKLWYLFSVNPTVNGYIWSVIPFSCWTNLFLYTSIIVLSVRSIAPPPTTEQKMASSPIEGCYNLRDLWFGSALVWSWQVWFLRRSWPDVLNSRSPSSSSRRGAAHPGLVLVFLHLQIQTRV